MALKTVVLVAVEAEAVEDEQEFVGTTAVAVEDLLSSLVSVLALGGYHEVCLWVVVFPPLEVFFSIFVLASLTEIVVLD